MTTNPRIIAARTAGLRAGMDSPLPRLVPDEFKDCAAEWYSAYDSMRVAVRNGVGAVDLRQAS